MGAVAPTIRRKANLQPKQHRVHIIGAVADICRDAQRKLEREGIEVIGYDDHIRNPAAYNPPKGTTAVLIGIDQAPTSLSHLASRRCEQLGLAYAVGELRKWSLMRPRLVDAGIVSPVPPVLEGPQMLPVPTPSPEPPQNQALSILPAREEQEEPVAVSSPAPAPQEAEAVEKIIDEGIELLKDIAERADLRSLSVEMKDGKWKVDWAFFVRKSKEY